MNNRVRDIISIDNLLATPIYKQIVQSVHRCIEKKILRLDDRLPSVNTIAEEFSLARGSVFTAYNELRASGIIDSIPGKGYFISSTRIKSAKRILLLLGDINAGSEAIYHAVAGRVADEGMVTVYFHHRDIGRFERLIADNAGYYNEFVISPEIHPEAATILSKLDAKQILLIENGFREFRKIYGGVYQNYEKSIQVLLSGFKEIINNYKRLFLVNSECGCGKDASNGFRKYSKASSMETGVISSLDLKEIKKGDAFILFSDQDLIELIKFSEERNYRLGKDLGILSFTEHPLKALSGGISTFSVDHVRMGERIAEMLLSKDREAEEIPFIVTDRKSF